MSRLHGAGATAQGVPLVSVIVPILNDAAILPAAIDSVKSDPGAEIIVVDGAPAAAGTRPLAGSDPRVRWTNAAVGRGRQMNHGARLARGRWLLFLHADTRLPAGWAAEIDRAAAVGAIGGCFRLRLDSPRLIARVIEWGVGIRVRFLRLPYGDQALFVRADVFRELGGYRELPIMEDVELVRRLMRRGRFHRAALPALTSARRWERDGWVRRSVENVVLVLLFLMGVSPHRLATRYGTHTSRPNRVAASSPSGRG